MGLLLAPILAHRLRSQQPLRRHLQQALTGYCAAVFGPDKLTLKLIVSSALVALVFFSVAEGNFRVSADAALAGRIERLIPAPEDGFIKSVAVKPGDKVHSGQPLAALEDSELRLEQKKWHSKSLQLAKEYRGAMANRDRSNIGILRAQKEQVAAELALVSSKLARLSIDSPIDGYVISGDLDQALGAPINKGDTLFTVAPLQDYRVEIHVDERDIAYIQRGQLGQLYLHASSDQQLLLTVEQLSPVAISIQDKNYFRVDALLQQQPGFLRPGMLGVAKVEIGREKLLWIWTHRFFDWLQLQLWRVF
jgi:multidrug resistance efflux pump